MGGAAEHLHCERWLNSARAFFQKANVLLFRFANAAERSPETDADPVLRPLLRIFNPGVIEREARALPMRRKTARSGRVVSNGVARRILPGPNH